MEGGRRKVLGSRSNQDLRFIMYNAQEREGEPYLFPLCRAPALRFFLLAPYPSGFLHFLFLFLSLPLARSHARTHVDALLAPVFVRRCRGILLRASD